jgi:NIMA (never in mitosis gene a)-related kinase
MKEINSPYIVKYVDSFVESSKLFIVMEHCAKGDLCKYIKAQMGKPIKEEVVWRFMIQILLGLYSLHSKKILHRDIKTLNIFLDDNYDIRIGDLGTAKTLST